MEEPSTGRLAWLKAYCDRKQRNARRIALFASSCSLLIRIALFATPCALLIAILLAAGYWAGRQHRREKPVGDVVERLQKRITPYPGTDFVDMSGTTVPNPSGTVFWMVDRPDSDLKEYTLVYVSTFLVRIRPESGILDLEDLPALVKHVASQVQPAGIGYTFGSRSSRGAVYISAEKTLYIDCAGWEGFQRQSDEELRARLRDGTAVVGFTVFLTDAGYTSATHPGSALDPNLKEDIQKFKEKLLDHSRKDEGAE